MPSKPTVPVRPQVLVVDDEASIRDVVRLALEEEGYMVWEAADGLVALEILRATRERLIVLLDWMMPRLSGDEVLAAVAADPGLAELHTYVLVTANAAMLPARSADLLARLGIPLLPKPFDMDALVALVSEIAERSKSAVVSVALVR
jgi:CheY-like chemotaxis protein